MAQPAETMVVTKTESEVWECGADDKISTHSSIFAHTSLTFDLVPRHDLAHYEWSIWPSPIKKCTFDL